MSAADSLPEKACDEAYLWVETYTTPQEAWLACRRSDWMLWLVAYRLMQEKPVGTWQRYYNCVIKCVINTGVLEAGDEQWLKDFNGYIQRPNPFGYLRMRVASSTNADYARGLMNAVERAWKLTTPCHVMGYLDDMHADMSGICDTIRECYTIEELL